MAMIKVAILTIVLAFEIEAFTTTTTSSISRGRVTGGQKEQSVLLSSRGAGQAPKKGLEMIGGMKWGNDDYLSSLGGSDEEKKRVNEKYDEFKESREAFILRQKERINSPSGQKFLQQLSKNNRRNFESSATPDQGDNGGAGNFFEDAMLYGNLPRSDESRFQNMMRQAAVKQMGGHSDVLYEDGFFAGGVEQQDGEEERNDNL